MITFDGERSKGRKWFAEKQLRVAKDLDIPGKTVQWEGFTFRVWQDGDLSGGRVTAPMGIAVMRVNSEPYHADLMIAESWQAGFVKSGPFRTVILDGTGYNIFNKPDTVSPMFRTFPFTTRATLSPAGAGQIGMYPNIHSTPSLFGMGEAVLLSLSSSVFVDENGNGIPDVNKQLLETGVYGYGSNGSGLVNRSCVVYNGTTDSLAQSYSTIFNLADNRQVVSHLDLFDVSASVLQSHVVISLSPLSFSYVSCASMWAGAPTGMIDDADNIVSQQATPFGRYAFSHNGVDVVLLGTKLTDMFDWPTAAASSWPDWRCFYSIKRGDTVSQVNITQFDSLLASKAGGALTNQEERRVLEQFFCWPNYNWKNAYDSAMFHGHDGNIYSWTRRYGSVKFTDTGLFDGGVTIPSDCATQGVRPEITHAGNGVYLCVCNQVASHITGVFVGSPFGTWTRLADPGAAFELLTVRPVSAIYNAETDTYSVVLIGVARRIATEDQPEAHLACIYRDGWLMLGQLPQHTERNEEDVLEPVAYDGKESYSICFFGDGPIVAGQMSYPAKPHCLPQMNYSPNYSDYAVGLP